MTRFLRNNIIIVNDMPNEYSSVFKNLFQSSDSKGWTLDSPGLQIDLPSHYKHHVFDDRSLLSFTRNFTMFVDQ